MCVSIFQIRDAHSLLSKKGLRKHYSIFVVKVDSTVFKNKISKISGSIRRTSVILKITGFLLCKLIQRCKKKKTPISKIGGYYHTYFSVPAFLRYENNDQQTCCNISRAITTSATPSPRYRTNASELSSPWCTRGPSAGHGQPEGSREEQRRREEPRSCTRSRRAWKPQCPRTPGWQTPRHARRG